MSAVTPFVPDPSDADLAQSALVEYMRADEAEREAAADALAAETHELGFA